MSRYLSLCVCFASLITSAFAQETPARFLRMPCLSPDGTRIAFTYQGNLWTCDSDGGVATRLTANEALDGSPKWSPDGKWIAFNSDREGAIQIFMIPSVGGAARQLTAYSGGVALHDWFPDSNSLLVITNRGEMRHSVYRMDIGTGALTRLYNDRIVPDSPRLSPDGKRFVFARGEGFDTLRRNYKGSANMDLYVATVDGSQPTRLLYRDANRMNDMWPTWVDGGQSVVFAHDSGGVTTFNKIGLNSGSVQPLFKASDMAFYAASSSATNRVVYESGFDLYSFKVGEQPKKLAIYCRSDSKGATAATATIASLGVQEFKISPDGKRIAVVARGEIFVAPLDRENEAKRVTSTPDRESGVTWSKDGKSLFYVCNESGSFNLYQVTLATLERKRLTSGAWSDDAPRVSPDGAWLAYIRQPKPSLRLMRVDGTGDHEVAPGPGIQGFEWSPDGKWLAYSRVAGFWDSSIEAVGLNDLGMATQTIRITRDPGENIRPLWSKNGEKLLFLSNRNRNRDIETINHSGSFTIVQTPLQKEKDTFDYDDDTETAPAKPDPKAAVVVKIDPDEIDRRAKVVFPFIDNVDNFTIAPDSKTVIFRAEILGATDFYQIDVDGNGLRRLTQSGDVGFNLTWSPDGSKLYYLSNGQVRWISLAGGGGAVQISGRMDINRLADWYAVFDEAWQAIFESYYDPKFHGVDWTRMKAKYRPAVEDVSVRGDLNYLINVMLGELNSSHMGFSGGTASVRPVRQTGWLGIEPDPSHHGQGVKVLKVQPRTPATRAESLLKPGDIILEVDGKPVENGLSFDRALADKVGRTTVLTVNGVVSTANARKVKIKPIAARAGSQLDYERWIDDERARTDKLSGGRVGYLHVPDMGDAARNRFERELFGIGKDKAAMVLDFRFNNGGDTHDSLLKFLDRRHSYVTMVPRQDAPYKEPERIFDKPTIVLIDGGSLSDAEVFALGYRTLKIGKMVGKPTMGWIIFTSGRGLLDGSFIRTPTIACLTPDGKDMELWGVPPDIEVDFEPSDFAAGRDPQLERAIQELMKPK